MDQHAPQTPAADAPPQEPTAAEQATQPTKPTVLRSHFKGLPKDWEKNKKANAEAAAEQAKKPSEEEK